MAPISILENSFERSIDAFLRFRTLEAEQKAVGSHLPVSKRNSTPSQCQQQQMSFEMLEALLAPGAHARMKLQNACDIGCGAHRRLDRSHSEPMRPQVPSQPQSQSGSSRYKTELCRPFGETGYCKYGDKCQFAHGKKELRSMTRHPKYKTELCRTFHTTGLCGYGSRCNFIHNGDERRSPTSPTSPQSTMLPSPIPTSTPYLTGEESIFCVSPPASHNGSPTSNAGLFFDAPFGLLPVKDTSVESLVNGEPLDSFIKPPTPPMDDLKRDSDFDQQRLAIFRNITDCSP